MAFPAVFETSFESTREQNKQILLQAFRSFTEAAESLERSYGILRAEVTRLRGELEESNAGLARSLESNRRMRRYLDRILKSIPCGVLVLNGDGEISLANPAARRLLAFYPGSGITSLARVPEDVRRLLERARRSSGEQEQSCRDGRGGKRWLAARHAPFRPSETGSGPACIFILRDVSEAKRMADERDRLRRRQALAEMSAILAHEIRNPLGSMELFAGLLAQAALSRDAARWVEQLQAGLRTLSATVNNVLHFHSLPSPARAPIDVGSLLAWAGPFLQPLARQAGIELRLHNQLQGSFFAADRHGLEQVLLNLVLNALRATPHGGCVEITGQRFSPEKSAEEEPLGLESPGSENRGRENPATNPTGETKRAGTGRLEITVADTGPGIAVAHLSRIFQPGFSTREGSPGLGLTVCHKIAEQHGGTLIAANRAGGGAEFRLLLPLGEPQSGKRANPAKESTP